MKGGVRIDFPGEESRAQRTKGNEAYSKFLASRQYLGFRISCPQRVFALDCGDRLHGMGAADRLRAGFGHAKVFDLACLNQFLDGTSHIFNRYIRINAVLVEQVNGIDLEPLE